METAFWIAKNWLNLKINHEKIKGTVTRLLNYVRFWHFRMNVDVSHNQTVVSTR